MVSLTYVERKQRIFIVHWKKRNKLLVERLPSVGQFAYN